MDANGVWDRGNYFSQSYLVISDYIITYVRHSLPLIQLSMYFSGSKNPANIDVDFNIKSCSSKRNTRPLFSHMLPLAFHSGFYSKYYSWCNHKAVSTSRFGTSISSI